jgi:hypothetical protein
MTQAPEDAYGENPFAAPERKAKTPAVAPGDEALPSGNTAPSDSSVLTSEEDTFPSVDQNAAPTNPLITDSLDVQRQEALDLAEQMEPDNFWVEQEPLPVLSIIPALHLGPATLALGVDYIGLYDSNILLSSTDTQSDFEHVLSPRLQVSLGDGVKRQSNYLALEYDPQLVFFQHYSQFNTLNQQLRLDGQYATKRTTLHESLAYNQTSDPDRELQGRDSRVVVSSDTTATYQLTGRISCELDGTALIRNFQDEINSDEGRLRFWTQYMVTPAWTVALGAAGGEVVPEVGNSQTFEQAWLRSILQVPGGLSFNLAMGGDFREMDSTSRLYATPVLDATIQYVPTTETQFDLSAIRQIFTSPDVVDQNYVSTRVSLRASQRFLQSYKMILEGGLENASYYEFDGVGVDGNRSDNFPYGRVELAYSRFQDLEVGVFYLFQKNFSSLADLSFSDQQAGLQIRIGF